MPARVLKISQNPEKERWWQDAVIYQIYPRSWADSDGDGVGDLPGITGRLRHLVDLGVDALWLSPFYRSPQNDAGYDVSDYRDVDPRFGTLEDFDELLESAQALGLRVVVDLVPNHSSHEHPWFQAALAASPGSDERARYIFRNGSGPNGDLPPNNWQSNFGGPAWTRVTETDGSPGQWYLHLFDVTQPDFDWTNPEVGDEMESVIRFWLDRGVDGFRIDVAHGLIKAPGLPDAPEEHRSERDATGLQPMWDQPGVHDIYRRWRKVSDEYPGDRLLCAEAWVLPVEALARYVRHDELHQSFNFAFLMTPWLADEMRVTIAQSLAAVEPAGAPQTWVLSNHDVPRHASRLGYQQHPGLQRMTGIGADDPQPDAAMGLRRARAATALMLALPGSAYLYQGEELGLPEASRLSDDVRQDPTWERSGRTVRGRDGCRVPIPWEADRPSYGFGPGPNSWLPQPAEFRPLAADRQRDIPGSTFELYRRLLSIRRELRLGRGILTWDETAPAQSVAFTITAPTDRRVSVIANLGSVPIELPSETKVLVSSVTERNEPQHFVAGDETVWVIESSDG